MNALVALFRQLLDRGAVHLAVAVGFLLPRDAVESCLEEYATTIAILQRCEADKRALCVLRSARQRVVDDEVVAPLTRRTSIFVVPPQFLLNATDAVRFAFRVTATKSELVTAATAEETTDDPFASFALGADRSSDLETAELDDDDARWLDALFDHLVVTSARNTRAPFSSLLLSNDTNETQQRRDGSFAADVAASQTYEDFRNHGFSFGIVTLNRGVCNDIVNIVKACYIRSVRLLAYLTDESHLLSQFHRRNHFGRRQRTMVVAK